MLVVKHPHPWDLTPRQAASLQEELSGQLSHHDARDHYDTVAGIDVGVTADVARAGVVVCALNDLSTIEKVSVEQPVTFPYVPGLLSFREAPAILEALSRLETTPDVLMLDGQGYAHPRRLGLASHIGVLLECPTIGCAKSRLCGTFTDPALERGGRQPLYDPGEIVGAVLRTRTGVKPMFVSLGHQVTLETAIGLVLRCGGGYRLPEPTRRAHMLCSERHARASAGGRP